MWIYLSEKQLTFVNVKYEFLIEDCKKYNLVILLNYIFYNLQLKIYYI